MTAKPDPIDIDKALARLNAAGRIVVTTHARADGDAIGCTAGLARVLRQQGKTVAAYLHEPVPKRYAFLLDDDPVATWTAESAADVIGRADLLVVVDTCSRMQLGDVAAAIGGASIKRLAIDHHQTADDVVDELWSDATAAACAQMIADLCVRAPWSVDGVTATLLYTGLATDTGWFRFSNADHRAYAAAARLIELGARPNELYERLYLNESVARARLIGAVMSSFELHADGRLAVIRVTREMLKRCDATPAMTEDLINEPQRVGSVMAAVLLVEPDDDEPVRVSFRSKRDVDVARIAASFGGGGHQRAAGARIPGAFDQVAKTVTAAIVAAIEGVN